MDAVIATQEHVVVCDNPNCDFSVPCDNGGKPTPPNELAKYLNKACPKCGENLLTEKDFKAYRTFYRIMRVVNFLFGWMAPKGGEFKKTGQVHFINGKAEFTLDE